MGSSVSLEEDTQLFSTSLMGKFESLLTSIIDQVLSQEGASAEIQRLAPDFRALIESLFSFFLENASLFSKENSNVFESFLKFYLIRSNHKYVRHFLEFLNRRLKPFLTGKYASVPDHTEVKSREFAALLRCFSILTSFNSFPEYKSHFLCAGGFSGFLVKNRYLNNPDNHDRSFLANRSLLLDLHLKNDFSIVLQFNPCSRGSVGRLSNSRLEAAAGFVRKPEQPDPPFLGVVGPNRGRPTLLFVAQARRARDRLDPDREVRLDDLPE